jgi:hypothetical protein
MVTNTTAAIDTTITGADADTEVDGTEQRPAVIDKPLVSAEQVKKDCPAKLCELGRRISVHLESAAQYEAAAKDHRISAGRLLAQAKAACTEGGFDVFHERFCPALGRTRTYELLAIASGEKSNEQVRAETRKRVKKHRAAKNCRVRYCNGQIEVATPAKPPPADDDIDTSAKRRKAFYAELDVGAETPSTPAPSGAVPTLDAKPDTVAGTNTKDSKKSAHALAEFKYACGHHLPKMNADHLHEAIRYCAGFAGGMR